MLPLTTITAVLFSLSIVLTYLAVRLRVANIPSALILGFMLNSLAFFMFAVARDNSFNQALFVGFFQGTIFTIASVTMGAFFRGEVRKVAASKVQVFKYSGEGLSTAA
jgi:xanthine/uracil/vitamin C permease (AzgA family)